MDIPAYGAIQSKMNRKRNIEGEGREREEKECCSPNETGCRNGHSITILNILSKSNLHRTFQGPEMCT